MSDVQCLFPDVRCSMCDFRCPLSDFHSLISDVRYPISDVWYPMSDFWCMILAIFDTRCLMSDVWLCACLLSDVWCMMFGVLCPDVRCLMSALWCLNSAVWCPSSGWCLMCDVWCPMSDVRLPLFDVFVYSKLEQNLPGQAKCEPTVVFLVGLSAELYANAYLCHGNIQWVKANLLKQYHRYSATTQTEDLERLSNHIFLKTKHPQGFVCKRTSVAEWLEFWNCNSEAPNLRPALTAS